jgi:Bacterial regulatory protein, Fis family
MMRPSLTWQTLAEVEREQVLNALRHTSGDWPSAARLLGVSLRRLRLRVKKYAAAGFEVSDFEAASCSGVSFVQNLGGSRKKSPKTADDALRRTERGDFESNSRPGSCAAPVKQPTVDLPRSNTLRWGALAQGIYCFRRLLARLPSWLMKDAGISPSSLIRRSGHR